MKAKKYVFNILFLIVIVISYSLFGLTQISKDEHVNCSNKELIANKTNSISESKNKSRNLRDVPFKIISSSCFKKNSICVLFVEAKYYTVEDMKILMRSLSKKSKAVKPPFFVNIYDDIELALALVEGKREPQSIQNDRRGWYSKTTDSEHLIFLPNKMDKMNFESIKLK
jgi:hypothetical protein